MVIEKVHGLRATNISMNERFTILAMSAPSQFALWQQPDRRRYSMESVTQYSNTNRLSGQQLSRRWNIQAKRAVKQRLGLPQSGLRRFGSEGNLQKLQRSNSFGNLSQSSVKSRVSWKQSNGNLSRSASFNDLRTAGWRNFRRRGGRFIKIRGRFRGRGRGGANGIGRYTFPFNTNQQQFRGQRKQTARRARGWARGRGGVTHKEEKPAMTKEELDRQLDQYMAGTKAALDLELDNYMKNVMDVE